VTGLEKAWGEADLRDFNTNHLGCCKALRMKGLAPWKKSVIEESASSHCLCVLDRIKKEGQEI
jgi:hypothetical protein